MHTRIPHMYTRIPHMHTRIPHMHTHTYTLTKQSKSKPVAAVYTVMPTQPSWDACALSRHSESVPPGDGTSARQEGCICLKDDGH